MKKQVLFHLVLMGIVLLFFKNTFSKGITNEVYGAVKYLDPLSIAIIGAETITIKFQLDSETKVILKGKTGTIYDLRTGQNVSVKYVQSERENVVYRVAKEIKLISTTSEVESLLAAQNDIDYNVKIEASNALSKIGKSAVPELIAILNDKDKDSLIRTKAAGTLGRIHDIRAIEPLIETLKDNYWLLRNGAKWALVEITGQNFEEDFIKWKSWWKENKAKYLNLIGDCIQQKPYSEENNYPCWLRALIAREEIGQVANPPASIWKCIYKSQIVYYLPSRCCDITSVLFNEKGDTICRPDGGFTGRGDGKCPDFFEKRNKCEIVWKDSRSYP